MLKVLNSNTTYSWKVQHRHQGSPYNKCLLGWKWGSTLSTYVEPEFMSMVTQGWGKINTWLQYNFGLGLHKLGCH